MNSLIVANGQKHKVYHVGSSLVDNYSRNSYILLKDLLHVSHITRNLLNFAKLTSDNKCAIVSDSNFCFAKNKATRRILM